MNKSSRRFAIPPAQRMLLVEAARRELPFALWRRPEGSRFECAISLSPIRRRSVFAAQSTRPAYLMAPFDCADAGVADAIEADLLVEGGAVRYFSADGGNAARPRTDAQSEFVHAAQAGDPRFAVRAGTSAPIPLQIGKSDYLALVADTVAAIRAGRFDKVVLSRAERRRLPENADLLDFAERLATRHPAAFISLIRRPGESAWLTATPETLLRRDADGRVRTMALAGTQAVAHDAAPTTARWSDKLVHEQALVRDYIRSAFAASDIAGIDESEAHTVRAGNLFHLRSTFSARIAPGEVDRAIALLRALHPTSAVCGQPRQAALEYLREHEGYDRSFYCGFIGPSDIDGSTHLFVNLRAAQLIGDTAVLYVGGGIVADSDPLAEWTETADKTRTVGAVLEPGGPAGEPARRASAGSNARRG